MRGPIPRAYGYDDLLLEPCRSDLGSRSQPSLSSNVGGIPLEVPIFSSPMDTVTENKMAAFMADEGGIGVIHRYMSIERQAGLVRFVKNTAEGSLVGASTGSNGDSIDRARALIEADVDLIVIDVAHGHSLSVLDHIKAICKTGTEVSIMSGNIATREAARDSLMAGANLLRVGIGAGAACTTRLQAGVGVPQLTAISSIREMVEEEGWHAGIVADGGIKHSGDIVKALAAGADGVMLGAMLANYAVAPRPGEYRGMASRDALVDYKGADWGYVAEGESFLVEVSDSMEDDSRAFASLVGAVKQGFAYLGAKDIQELRQNARWVEVTGLGYAEGQAHFGRMT